MATSSNNIKLNITEKGAEKTNNNIRNIALSLGAVAVAYGAYKLASKALGTVGKQVKKAVDAARIQQVAVAQLAIATGENTAELELYASELQKVTVLGDEFTLSIIKQLSILGVQNKDLKSATTNTLGLAKALDIDYKSAARYYALALQGQTSLLARYIPQVRTAKTETEQLAAINRVAFKGKQLLTLEADFDLGEQISNIIGDLYENVGIAMQPTLKNIKDSLITVLTAPEFKVMATSLGESMAKALEKVIPVGRQIYASLLGMFGSSELKEAFLATVDNTEAIKQTKTQLEEAIKDVDKYQSKLKKAQDPILIAKLQTQLNNSIKERNKLQEKGRGYQKEQNTTNKEYKKLLGEEGSLLSNIGKSISAIDFSGILQQTKEWLGIIGDVLTKLERVLEVTNKAASAYGAAKKAVKGVIEGPLTTRARKNVEDMKSGNINNLWGVPKNKKTTPTPTPTPSLNNPEETYWGNATTDPTISKGSGGNLKPVSQGNLSSRTNETPIIVHVDAPEESTSPVAPTAVQENSFTTAYTRASDSLSKLADLADEKIGLLNQREFLGA